MMKQIAGPLVQLLRRDHVHAQDIAVVLEFLRRRLGEEGIPFAVIGALALRQYGFVRATEDIDIDGIRFPTMEALVEFKIASGVWGHRHQDLGDVQNLICIHGLGEAFAQRLPPTLQDRFLTLLRDTRAQRDLEK